VHCTNQGLQGRHDAEGDGGDDALELRGGREVQQPDGYMLELAGKEGMGGLLEHTDWLAFGGCVGRLAFRAPLGRLLLGDGGRDQGLRVSPKLLSNRSPPGTSVRLLS
jgi:hypothetical protein